MARVMSDNASVLVKSLIQSRRFDFDANTFYFESPMVDLVQQMEQIAAARGLTLSRWQTNKGNRSSVVTWMLHSGERAVQARYQQDVVESVVLYQIEGKTERSEAYRALSNLLADMSVSTDRTPMVAAVLAVMNRDGVDQDTAVCSLGGRP